MDKLGRRENCAGPALRGHASDGERRPHAGAARPGADRGDPRVYAFGDRIAYMNDGVIVKVEAQQPVLA
jgi:hypothetical protein